MKKKPSVAARCKFIAADRIDIQFACKEVCRRMSALRESDWRLTSMARYVKSHPHVLLPQKYQEPPKSTDAVVGTDLARCRRTRKSTSGDYMMHGTPFIKRWATTQTVIVMSSGEAESSFVRTLRCHLFELEREVFSAKAAEDVNLPIVPLVQCTSEAFWPWLLLVRHGRHGRCHSVVVSPVSLSLVLLVWLFLPGVRPCPLAVVLCGLVLPGVAPISVDERALHALLSRPAPLALRPSQGCPWQSRGVLLPRPSTLAPAAAPAPWHLLSPLVSLVSVARASRAPTLPTHHVAATDPGASAARLARRSSSGAVEARRRSRDVRRRRTRRHSQRSMWREILLQTLACPAMWACCDDI